MRITCPDCGYSGELLDRRRYHRVTCPKCGIQWRPGGASLSSSDELSRTGRSALKTALPIVLGILLAGGILALVLFLARG